MCSIAEICATSRIICTEMLLRCVLMLIRTLCVALLSVRYDIITQRPLTRWWGHVTQEIIQMLMAIRVWTWIVWDTLKLLPAAEWNRHDWGSTSDHHKSKKREIRTSEMMSFNHISLDQTEITVSLCWSPWHTAFYTWLQKRQIILLAQSINVCFNQKSKINYSLQHINPPLWLYPAACKSF